ncbi:transposase [Bradyrhizobium jicamae]|uniref:Transposase n=1 Tax=Bradyrhizobium jicamae TaxID=280332 RepID=A0ABS5FVS5_9BRAD|nr:transposase [Bradyrhizobium jicamae]MBR0800679.1 transposase [Bradyrhizobium jicamae]
MPSTEGWRCHALCLPFAAGKPVAGALRQRRHDRITAAWFIEGPINGEAFLLCIERVLVPTLRLGDIVIVDNPARTGPTPYVAPPATRLFYLPKYSPDLNPIEQFFAKFRQWLRNAGARRTIEEVYEAIARSAECP